MTGKKIKHTSGGGSVQKPGRLSVHENDKSPAGPIDKK